MSKQLLRATGVLLLLALFASLWATAFAVTWFRGDEQVSGTEKYVYAYSVKVYEKPDKNSKGVETVPFAREILCLAERGGWTQVITTNHHKGFCETKYLTANNPNTLNETMYCQKMRVPYYALPSLKSSISGHLDRNETVTLVAMTPKGDWLRVKHGDIYRYIPRPYLDYSKFKKKAKKAWIVSDVVPVYFDPDIDCTFSTLYFGQPVYLLGIKGEWAKIRSGSGLIAYCSADAVSMDDPGVENPVVYTQVSGNYLFVSSSDLSGRRNVEANERMELLAVDENQFWARVKYKKNIYYVPYVLLDTEMRVGDYKKVTTRTGVNVREGTKRSSAIVVTLPTGTDLWLIDATDNCAKVSTSPTANGSHYVGYVELQYLR